MYGRFINRYWLILVSELVLMFLITIMEKHHMLVVLFAVVMILLSLLTIEICFELKFLRAGSVISGAIAVISGLVWLVPWLSSQGAYGMLLLASCAFSAFYSIAIIAIGKHVFMSTRATINTITGSICIYLLIGICFAFVYNVLSMSLGGRFFLDGAPMHTEARLGMAGFKEFLYFSFSTLTTTGYGDIVPKDSLTRMTSYIEGILGSLYLAVVVAKLVGMYVTQNLRNQKL
jgi:hypothetical protein